MDHLILAATDLGLGTCWIAAFDPTAAREVLELPDGVEPIVFTPLGYPADQLRGKQRKAISDLVQFET
jgi:nitroreductase